MEHHPRVGFNLQPLLEELNAEELSQFKSLLKSLPQESIVHQQEFPKTEIDDANGKQLAEILNGCRKYWAEMVTVQILDKMNRVDLSKRAMDEIQESAVKSLREIKASMVDVTTNHFRTELKTKFDQIWKNNFCPEATGNFPIVTERYKALIPFCNPQILTGPLTHTVVLHGAAGVGKSTLAKKLMTEWTDGNLARRFQFVFYLNCKQLNQMGPCSCAELIAKDCPELDDASLEVIAKSQNVLVVIDDFDELSYSPGALIRDICDDLKTQKPVPILLSSLLTKKILPRATVLITTRSWALRELRLLMGEPLVIIKIEGFSETDRKDYFLKNFEDEYEAMKAFDLIKSHTALFPMCSAPIMCWLVCKCLKLQMEKREDPTATCQTTTSLFLHVLCNQFSRVPGACPSRSFQAPLKVLCLLAARGVWKHTSLFAGEDVNCLGVKESEISPFLGNIIQKDKDNENYYSFVHLNIQQFLAAIFYILGSEEEDQENHRKDIGDIQKLFTTEEILKNPNLTQLGYFIFGLLSKNSAKELETKFGYRVSSGVKEELLTWKVKPIKSKPFLWSAMKDTFRCLYESQEEEFVRDAMAPFTELSLHLRDEIDMTHAAFCLKGCHNLQKLSLKVTKEMFVQHKSLKSQPERYQREQRLLDTWMDLCAAFTSNKNLTSLEVNQSYLKDYAVVILAECLASKTNGLQKVALNNVSPADAYEELCAVFCNQKTLTHLTLQSNGLNMLPLLCSQILTYPESNLQYLRLGVGSVTIPRWGEFSLALKTNQSLTCLNLTDNELSDDGAKLLCKSLKESNCSLQRLSLENCRLTEGCCEDLSILVRKKKLTHLCLAKNELGNGGVQLLCKGLSDPNCKLQTLVLCCCEITDNGCNHLAKFLLKKSSLTQLDLGQNRLGVTGLISLCETLKDPVCNLKCLWLWGCSLVPYNCMDLSSALKCNQRLTTLDLGQNSLGNNGIKMLCEALKQQNHSLTKLRLQTDPFDTEMQKLLQEVQDRNPQLTIEKDEYDLGNPRPSCRDFFM
ncbi:PREDICTED: NACHT, LRR and PYD domains-containing protein 2-like [Chrysochloris asiatica]|uniref:NACHT, LRR and PYD domains-containing protein 2-like n=1 Tax=Chrysochloris asiatica TaxID=185453 RepID=A0A9B0WSF2_CHRAS|nr:PREDICTED: NACHT, LRR and PYD domains-containing protein 2-like [Chrysochloris asiatica]